MKDSAQIALIKLDLQDVIENMNKQASYRLRNTDVKQLEGMEAQDFTQLTILKVLDGTRDWMNASTNDMIKFLRMSLMSEISNYLKHLYRRDVGIETYVYDDYDDNYENNE